MFQRLSAVIGAPSGILLLMFFFLPWVTLSCEAVGGGSDDLVNANGLDLATGDAYDSLETNIAEAGTSVSSAFGAEDLFSSDGSIPLEPTTDDSFTTDASLSFEDSDTDESFDVFKADARLWLIPIAGLIALVVAGMSFSGMLPSIASGAVYILASVFAFAAYILKYMDFQDFTDELESTNVASAGTASFELNFEAGFYLTVAAIFGIFAAGCVAILFDDLMQKPKAPTALPDIALFSTDTSEEVPHKPSWMQ